MGKALISVLLPVKNGEKYIAEAINSLLAQTYPYFEIVLVNDGSNDATKNIITSFDDDRIKLFETSGIGLVAALNYGLNKCQGEYIARMDADDIAFPERFQKQIEVFEINKNVGLVCTDVEVIDENDNIVGQERAKITNRGQLIKGLTFRKRMKPIIHPSTMIKKDLITQVGGYRDYQCCEDRDLWLRLYPITDFYRIQVPLLKYRRNPDGISQKNFIKQKANSMMTVLDFYLMQSRQFDLYNNLDQRIESYTYFSEYANDVKEDHLEFKKFKSLLRLKKNILGKVVYASCRFYHYKFLKLYFFEELLVSRVINKMHRKILVNLNK